MSFGERQNQNLEHTPNRPLRSSFFSLLAIRVYKGLENEPMEGNNFLPPPPGNNVNTENNFLHRHNLKIQKLQ